MFLTSLSRLKIIKSKSCYKSWGLNKLDGILVFIKLLDKSERVTKSKWTDNNIAQMHAAS